MNDLRTAAQQALEALEQSETFVPYEGFGMARKEAERRHQAAITALRAALAQQDEPAQAISECIAVLRPMVKGKFPHEQALDELVGYTAPPQRKPLTEEEIESCRQKGYAHAGLGAPFDFGKAARAVEKASWEKNE